MTYSTFYLKSDPLLKLAHADLQKTNRDQNYETGPSRLLFIKASKIFLQIKVNKNSKLLDYHCKILPP